jgi:hypothetical protein
MAIQENNAPKPVMKNGVRQADAWLNLSVTDKNGKAHKLGGIPLHRGHQITEALLAKSGVKVGENKDIDLEITANIALVDHEPKQLEL